MILYYAPGACSLADHIALREAALPCDLVRVDLGAHATEDGRDFTHINAKGYVPALEMDDGYVLTENIAILMWIADQAPKLSVGGALGRYRLLETLAFLSTEVHKAFKPFFAGAADPEKARAGADIAARLDLLAGQIEDPFLFGDALSVADAYLYVMVSWARRFGLRLAPRLADLFARMNERPAVRQALAEEGLA